MRQFLLRDTYVCVLTAVIYMGFLIYADKFAVIYRLTVMYSQSLVHVFGTIYLLTLPAHRLRLLTLIMLSND